MSLLAPEYVDGRKLWVDPEVQEIIDLMHNGDPTLGWEGDPRLALYRTKTGWELDRMGEDGYLYTIARSRKDLKLDRSLIVHLVAHDTRRKSALKQHDELAKLKETAEAASDAAHAEKVAERLEKVYWGAKRDIGHHY
jgi:hypothetical protein